MTAERICILHIGQPKTGSSSIQYALAGYDDGSTFAASFKDINHSGPIDIAFRNYTEKLLMLKRRGFIEAELRQYRELYRDEFSTMLKRRDRSRIIVSAESIWRLSDADKVGLVEFIRQHGWEVQVIAYVREPIGFTTSLVSERIRGQKCLAKIIPKEISPNYRLGLSAFADLLPPEHLHVRNYNSEQLTGGDSAEDFCQVLDLNLPRNISQKNNRLSLSAVRLLFRFNRSRILFNYDPELFNARNRLKTIVAKAYAGDEPLYSSLCAGIADWSDTDWLYETFGIDFRQKPPLPATSASELEAFLADISGIDLSCLDKLLAGYGIRYRNFITADKKLHRLFYALLIESATGKRDRVQAKHGENQIRLDQDQPWSRVGVLFHNPGKNLAKYLCYQVLRRLSNFSILSHARREKLALRATRLRNRWIGAAP